MEAMDFFVKEGSDVCGGRLRSSDLGEHSESGCSAVGGVGDLLVDSVTDLTMLDGQLPPDVITDTSTEEEDRGKCTDRLTLAYERLFEIPRTIVDRFSDHVKYFDISHNKITNLDNLVYFTKLTSLIADDNPINEECLLPPLPTLQLLWLNHCKISSLFPWIRNLQQACPNLQYLCLMGNPAAPSYLNGGTFYEYLQYRLFVISQFPALVHLDDRAVTDDQRREAQRLYKKPFFERLLKPGSGGISAMVSKTTSWNFLNLNPRSQKQHGNAPRNLLI